MSDMDEHWHDVAERAHLADPGSVAFTLIVADVPLFGFVVQKGGALYAYENFCPHAGRQLNWGPDRFLTSDQSLIMCAAHGALFEIETGVCAAGPCVGESLRALEVRDAQGIVQIRQVAPAQTMRPQYPGS